MATALMETRCKELEITLNQLVLRCAELDGRNLAFWDQYIRNYPPDTLNRFPDTGSFREIGIICQALECSADYLLGFNPSPLPYNFETARDRKVTELVEQNASLLANCQTHLDALGDLKRQLEKTQRPVHQRISRDEIFKISRQHLKHHVTHDSHASLRVELTGDEEFARALIAATCFIPTEAVEVEPDKFEDPVVNTPVERVHRRLALQCAGYMCPGWEETGFWGDEGLNPPTKTQLENGAQAIANATVVRFPGPNP